MTQRLLVLLFLLLALPALAQQELRGSKKGATVPMPITGSSVDADHNALDVKILGGSGGGTSATDNSVFTGGTTAITPIGAIYDLTPPVVTDGNVGVPRMNANRQLQVDCVVGCSGSSFADNAAFTFGTTSIGLSGYVLDDVATNAVTENSAGLARMSSSRIVYSNPTNASGTALFPTAFASADNIAAQTATAMHGFTYIWDGASWDRWTGAVTVTGSVTVTDGAGALNVIVDSGSITANAGTNLNTSALALEAGGNLATVASVVDVLGTAVPLNGAFVAGTDGTNSRALKTDAAGELQVDVLTLPSVTVGTFPDNEPFNVAQVAGVATVTAAAGVQRIGIAGSANAAIDAANNAAAPANVLVAGFETATQTVTQPTASTTGNVRRAVAGTDGVLYSRLGGPVQWTCNLAAVGTTLTECQPVPGAGLRLYITDIVAISATTTTGLFTLRFGTGAACVTGTGNLFFASAAATIPNLPNNAVAGPQGLRFITPIAVTANNAICVLGVVTNTTNIQIRGYTAP